MLAAPLIAVALAVAAQPAPARADTPLITECDGADMFGGTDLERAAWCLLREWRFASLRTMAERAVAEGGETYRTDLLLGVAFHLGEANLPRALWHVEEALRRYDAAAPRKPAPERPEWFVLRLILLETSNLCGEMNLHERQIATVDVIRDRLGLDLVALKAWPLVKLRRFDEARAVALAAMQKDGEENRDQREDGATALCAVESELQRREEALAACRAAALPYLGDGAEDGGVFIVNLAIASAEMLRWDDAERLYLEATRRRVESTINPWGNLAQIYVRQGRLAEALEAWRNMLAYRARRPPHMAQQDQAQAELVGATLLMLAGRTEDAQRVTSRVVDQPERLGASSASQEQHLAANHLMDRVMHLEQARRLEEEASFSAWRDAWTLRARAWMHRLDAFWAGRGAARYLQDAHLLSSTLRPDCPGSVEIPVWLKGAAVDVTGGGVARAAVARARAVETLPEAVAGPYFDAFEAEAAWRSGEDAEVLERARGLRERLGRNELMLRTRMAVLAADAARTRGDADAALAFAEEALRVDPGMFRRVGVRVPVRLLPSAEPAAVAAAGLLEKSPRLEVVPWGLALHVGTESLFLEQADGTVVLEAPVPAGDDADTMAVARRIARAVHQDLLHPRVDMTQGDVSSLDGGLGRGTAMQEKTRSILEQMTRPRGP